MERTRQHLHEQPARQLAFGEELRRLKSDGATSVDELRDFVGRMHGRSTQEVLGLAGESDLLRCTGVATAGFVVILILFTALPYWFQSGAAEPSAASPASQSAAAPAPSESATANATSDSAPDADVEVNAAQAADRMGINETEVVDPKVNPLDKDLDSLLDIE